MITQADVSLVVPTTDLPIGATYGYEISIAGPSLLGFSVLVSIHEIIKKSQYINFNPIIVPTCWIEQENPNDANNPNIFEFMKDGCGVNFLNVATTTPW